MARAVIRLLLTAGFVASVLLGDIRPGWCPFVDPTPGQEITAPHVPPAVAPTPTPTPPSFPRHTEAERSFATPRSPKPIASEPWRPSLATVLGLGTAVLLVLLLPAVWMRMVFRRFDLPPELEPHTGAFARVKRKQSR